MPAILVQALMGFITKLFMSMCGERMIEWFFFKVCELCVKSTKTPCDDEFYEQVKKSYQESQGRDNASVG